MTFEFLIPRRPLSLQAKNNKLQQWKAFVHEEAAKVWTKPAHQSGDFQFTLVYLCGDAPPDVDNIIKPIQDALRRRPMIGTFDLTRLPQLLLKGINSQKECVYVRVDSSRSLEDYL